MATKYENQRKMKKSLTALTLSLTVMFVLSATFASADLTIKEKQVAAMSETLKNVIEQNHSLATKNQRLETQISKLRMNAKVTKNEMPVVHDTMQLASLKSKTATRNSIQKSNQDSKSITDGVFLLAANKSKSTEEVKGRENETTDLLSRIDAFTEGDERLREDAAKAHYNMGNIYFQKGEYEIAVREYYQAVTLMPDDPDSHFNLAFVSGEQLNDQKTALKHYKMYLYLNPTAKDSDFVKEKIVKAELFIRGLVDSPLER